MKAIALLLLASFAAVAGDRVELQCQNPITTHQSIVSTHPGWYTSLQGHNESAKTSSRGTVNGFSYGPPEKLMIQAPISSNRSKSQPNEFINTWGVTDEIWFYCDYEGTKIRLAKPIPSGMKHCFIKYGLQDTQPAWCTRS